MKYDAEKKNGVSFGGIVGRFDVIATGSLLGVRGYSKSDKTIEEGQDSIPVGYETVVEMYPLDFEEFLWANGINDKVIDSVKACFENDTTVPDGIHKVMMELQRDVIIHRLQNCHLRVILSRTVLSCTLRI